MVLQERALYDEERMGRRRIELSEADIREALKGRTISEGAKELGVGRTTLVSRIGDLNLGEGRGNYIRKYRRRKKRSIVHQRLVENSGSVLSGDPMALSRLFKIHPETVRAYLKRGKKGAERFIKEILHKAPKDFILTTINNDKVPIASINKMTVILDRWGRKVTIVVTLKNERTEFLKYNVQKLWDALEEKVENDRKRVC